MDSLCTQNQLMIKQSINRHQTQMTLEWRRSIKALTSLLVPLLESKLRNQKFGHYKSNKIL